VPVDQVVPSDHVPGIRSPAGGDQALNPAAGTGGPLNDDRPVMIDLGAVEQVARRGGELLARYLRAIEVQRGDYNGRMLTIRGQDLTAMACIFGCHPDQVPARLDSLGVRLVR
jgi:hypothetical protein